MEDVYRMEDPYKSDGSSENGAKKRNPIFIAVLVVIVLALCASIGYFAWNALRPVDIEAYKDMPITITGLTDSELVVTDADLIEMDCIQLTVTGQGSGLEGESKAGAITGYGPTLETFLANYGYAPTDFNRIICTCKDGYDVVLYGEMLNNEVVLSIAQGKDPLWESHQPLRLIIPSESTGIWAYGVQSITFER